MKFWCGLEGGLRCDAMRCDATRCCQGSRGSGKETQDRGDRVGDRVRDKEKGNESEEEQKYCRQAEGEGLC